MESRYIPKTTIAYGCWDRYKNNYLQPNNIQQALTLCREYVRGKQWKNKRSDIPQPVMNICREYVEKVSCKILGTPYAVNFIGERADNDLHNLDDFYQFQMKQIEDEKFNSIVCKQGLIDGTVFVFTSYDKDTIGIQGEYKGYIQRDLVLFENAFFENPHTEDLQHQRYLGYVKKMEISAVKEMVEGSARRKKNICDLIVPDDYDFANPLDDVDSKECLVITRFFRDKDGEVAFEVATKYADLFEHPHFLNPKKNKEFIVEDRDKKKENGEVITEKGIDYTDVLPAQYTTFEKPIKQSDSDYRSSLRKFTRYPISSFTPYPVVNEIIGESGVFNLIQQQNIINTKESLSLQIMMIHASPKWLVKGGQDTLKGQKIDNSPNQVLYDYSTYGNGFNISRVQSASQITDSINKDIQENIALVKETYGFANINTDNLNDTSGYAFQQATKQINVPLEQPQKRFWYYIGDNARIDICYFRHYIKEAKYLKSLSLGEVKQQETAQQMNMQMNLLAQPQENEQPKSLQQLLDESKPISSVVNGEVNKDMFMYDWQVAVDVCQGIANSEISVSQHVNELAKIFASQQTSADVIEMIIVLDPAIPKNLKAEVQAMLYAQRNSQLAQKDAEIQQYKQTLQQLTQKLQQCSQQIKYQEQRVQAMNQAVKENAKTNQGIVRDLMSQLQEQQGETADNKGTKQVLGGETMSNEEQLDYGNEYMGY